MDIDTSQRLAPAARVHSRRVHSNDESVWSTKLRQAVAFSIEVRYAIRHFIHHL